MGWRIGILDTTSLQESQKPFRIVLLLGKVNASYSDNCEQNILKSLNLSIECDA